VRYVVAALAACGALAAAPAAASDRLGFPVYPHAVLRGMRATGAIYTSSAGFGSVVAWYRAHARADWKVTPATTSTATGTREQEFRFVNAAGWHTILVSQGNAERVAVITELVTTKQAAAAAEAAAWRAVHPPGGIDSLGVPVYPHAIPGKGFAHRPELPGMAMYATRDDLGTVIAWYAARLAPRGYDVRTADTASQAQPQMTVFSRGNDSVTIARGRRGGLTTIIERIVKPR